MKIGFIKPLDPNLTGNNIILNYFENRESFKSGSMNIYYMADLTLLTLAGRLENRFKCFHIDEDADGVISGEEDFDLVYINAKSQQSKRAYEISELFMKRGIITVGGGTHITAVPEDARGKFTSILIGEEDLAFDSMIKDLTSGKKLKSQYVNDKFLDLNDSPCPRYEILDTSKYGMIPIQATRGCPHNCTFCFSTKFLGRRLRHKPVQNVIDEIREIKKYVKNPNLFFMDDNMLSDRKYVIELLKELKKENIRWCTFTDISFAHQPEILKLLPESGCSEVLIGFETVSIDSMDQVSEFKRRELENYEESIAKIQNAGIGIIGSFMVGFDNDTKKSFQKIYEFIERNMLHEISISILTPYPGTDLFKKYKDEGRLTNLDYENYSDLSWNINFKPENLSVEEIREGINFLLDKVYSKEMFIKRMKHFKKLAREKLD